MKIPGDKVGKRLGGADIPSLSEGACRMAPNASNIGSRDNKVPYNVSQLIHTKLDTNNLYYLKDNDIAVSTPTDSDCSVEDFPMPLEAHMWS